MKLGTQNRKADSARKRATEAAVIAGVLETEPQAFPPTDLIPTQVHDVWHAVVNELGGSNSMRPAFVPIIEAYALAVNTHALAGAEVQESGILVEGVHGPVANPMLKVQKDSAATMLRLAETLGLTPAARIRLGLLEITGQSLLTTLNTQLDT